MRNRYRALMMAMAALVAAVFVSDILNAGQVAPPPGPQGAGAAGARGGARGNAPPAPPAGPMARTPDGKPDMSGYWVGNFFTGMQQIQSKNILVDPPDSRIPYQPEFAAKAKDTATNRMYEEPELHCFLSGVPNQMYRQFGFQIVLNPEMMLMSWDFMNGYRFVHLDGRPHLPAAIKLFQGDSIGRWEGDTLVVDTTNQNDRTWLDAVGNIHSDVIHVVERFTPVDANTITYEAVIEDPKAYTRPWKVVESFRRNTQPGYEQMEFACIEGNRDKEHYPEGAGGKAKELPPEQRAVPTIK